MLDLNKITKICTISDVHGEYHQLLRAVSYAQAHEYFIVFLGDLTDGGSYPKECIDLVKSVVDAEQGVFIIGNHDKKFYSYSLGRPVTLKQVNIDTIRDAQDGEHFLSVYKSLVEHPLARFYLNVGNLHFAHAAIDPVVWTGNVPDLSVHRLSLADKFVYGFHTGAHTEEGWPIRSYEWIKDIPVSETVIVGHDRVGLGKPHTKVKISSAHNRGTVVYSDTSCGKDIKGPLSSVFLKKIKGKFMIQGVSQYGYCPSNRR